MNTEYQYGRRWNVHTPRAAVERYVNGLHVAVTEDEIRQFLADKIEAARKADPRWSDVIARQTIAFALLVHARNRDLYARVIRWRRL